MNRGYYIPSVYGMRLPGASNRGFSMIYESGTGRGKWGAVEIIFTMDLIIG